MLTLLRFASVGPLVGAACALSLAPGVASAQNAPWGTPPPPSSQAAAWGELSAAPTGRPRCIESDTTARVAVELLAGFGVGAVIFGAMAAALLIPDDGITSDRTALPILVGGGLASILLTPLAVYGVGNAYGGDGSYGTALLGTVLLGFPGAVIGYEVTTTPACRHDATGALVPHPRRASHRTTERSPVFAPLFVPPTAAQGASMVGLTLRM